MLSIYRTYIGEPNQERDIYLGFGLFFAGVTLGIVGLALYVHSSSQPPGSELFWQSRTMAFVAGTLGLPAAILSIVVLLPVGRQTLITGIVGAIFCVIAAGILINAYPSQWSTEATIDGGVRMISVYAFGLILLSVATGTALVAQYIERAAPQSETVDGGDTTTEANTATDSDVTDDQVEADISAALDDTELSWGGVEKQPNTKRLKLNTSTGTDAEIERADPRNVEATTTRSKGDSVDDAVDGLRRLQGGETNTQRGTSTEDQVAALTEFREEQETEAVETGVDESSGLTGRIRKFFF
ncbi:DUF7139 domain-containing protein [Halobellus rufus]|uniref:DUF7139 domain-containing protein n=1 Tax=Halobellus rufus TaxID=1448860 RepID=UPI0006797B94|nr:permease [Halobellus rufus]